jgi:hypothetical protein
MLDEMQAQWLAKVAEGCTHARVGLTLRGAFSGGLSTGMLVHIMGCVFGGTQAHLRSCISTGRMAATARGLLAQKPVETVAALFANSVVDRATTKAKASGTVRGGPKQQPTQHDQEQLPPRLALVSHALALTATPRRLQLQMVLPRLDLVAAEAAAGGCEWLHAYCDFLQRRYRLGS